MQMALGVCCPLHRDKTIKKQRSYRSVCVWGGKKHSFLERNLPSNQQNSGPSKVTKCSIHGEITACSHLTLFRKLYSPSEQRQPPFLFLSSQGLPASLCVRWNLECTTFSKSDLLRTAPQLDWILTQISVPKDKTAPQMERGQRQECVVVLAGSQVWVWSRGLIINGSKLILHSLAQSKARLRRAYMLAALWWCTYCIRNTWDDKSYYNSHMYQISKEGYQ